MSSWRADSPPLSVDALVSLVRQGTTPDFVCFPDWGGASAPGILAPWAPSPFVCDGASFVSAEQHFMHAKATLFADDVIAKRIMQSRCSAQARELGRRVRGFSETVWQSERVRLMDDANRAKFGALPEQRDYLLSTWPAVLVQASPLDTVWGSGLDLGDPFLHRPWQWPGQNLVGFSLMRVREELRTAINPARA